MTSKRFKDFGDVEEVDADSELEPVEFKLGGENFVCRPELQGYTLMKFSAKATSSEGNEAIGAVLDLFKTALTDESFSRFEKLVESPTKIVRIEKLMEIVEFLIEEYANRDPKA